MTKAENEALYDEWKEGKITWWEFLDEIIKKTDETDKKFLLHLLLIWYQGKLERDIEDEAEPAGVKDAYALLMMYDHKKVAKEMTEVLATELF